MQIKNSVKSNFLVLVIIVVGVSAFPEKGKWTFDINQDIHYVGVSKSMFSGTNITFKSKHSPDLKKIS